MRGVLFDLDGTLADTAPDLGWALNTLLAEHQHAPLPLTAIRPVASHGARGLIQLGFGMDRDHPDFERLRLRFLDLYDQHFAVDTVLYDGVQPLIEALAQRGLVWGIVTNKPMRFTDRLVPRLGFPVPPAAVVSGDTVGVAKPDPRPMHHAAQLAGVAAARCLYVGDAERDIQAGRASGMVTVLAGYGYIAATDTPAAWGADHNIAAPLQLVELIDRIWV